MNKIKILAFLLAALPFVSCETEPVDPYLSGAFDSEVVTSFDDYFPRNTNNVWRYKTNGRLDSTSVVMSGAVPYEDAMWFKMNHGFDALQPENAENLVKRIEDDYLFVTAPVTVTERTTSLKFIISSYKYLILKENLAQGATWNQTVNYKYSPFGFEMPEVDKKFLVESTIIEKNIPVTVNGNRYENVIHVKHVFKDFYSQDLIMQQSFWLAKGVGVIRTLSEYENGTTTTKVLDSYTVNE